MKDLTVDSVGNHILVMAAPVVISMLTQMAYQLVNLYFITQIGVAATAGVNAAGNVLFVVAAFTQMLGVGTAALIAHAAGRKDARDANLVFNQSMVLCTVLAAATIALLCTTIRPYMQSVAADAATIRAGATFLFWMLPGFALMFPMSVVSSALRGIGEVGVAMMIYMITVIVNAALAPILIAGWGTGVPLGVVGAGLATSLSVAAGVVLLCVHLHRAEHYLRLTVESLSPRIDEWRRIVVIGLPASAELLLTFLSTAVVYYAIRSFGAASQAGFGIGSRVLQALLIPGMAIAFAAGPIAGQNFGAMRGARVLETFRKASLMAAALTGAFAVFVYCQPHALVRVFDADRAAAEVAALFLRLMSWAFVAQVLVYTCSTMFQGLGNTLPPLFSSAVRFLLFTAAALWLCRQPQFRIEHIWYIVVATSILQAMVSLWLLRREVVRRVLPILQADSSLTRA